MSHHDPVELATRLVGGVWGHVIADAVGVPYEFRSAGQIGEVEFGATGTHQQPPGTWSDDGALMLALLDSLLSSDGFDVEDQGRRSVAWYRDGEYTPEGDGPFDVGNTTRVALAAIARGAPASDAGPTGERECGNGSLMRILPIALAGHALDAPTLVDHAMRASRVTHGHPRAQVACALYVLVARRLLAGQRDRTLTLTAATDDLRAVIAGDDVLVAASEHLLGWTERHGRGVVWDSFWSAWDAFAGADSYAATIERAVRYGNDTDTTAAIAGGLAGIYWTIDGIPIDWLARMRGGEVVRPLVDRLLATEGWRTSTTNPIRVNWVDLSGVPRLKGATGALGMTFLPGKQRDGWTGMHWRDLGSDASRMRQDLHVDALLLLVEDHELETARVRQIAETLAEHDIDLIRFPIVDMDVTSDRQGLGQVLDGVMTRCVDGQRVVVACRGGLGRTGTIVGCLLRDGGLDGPAAVDLTRSSRDGAIESGGQEEFVRAWDRDPQTSEN